MNSYKNKYKYKYIKKTSTKSFYDTEDDIIIWQNKMRHHKTNNKIINVDYSKILHDAIIDTIKIQLYYPFLNALADVFLIFLFFCLLACLFYF